MLAMRPNEKKSAYSIQLGVQTRFEICELSFRWVDLKSTTVGDRQLVWPGTYDTLYRSLRYSYIRFEIVDII